MQQKRGKETGKGKNERTGRKIMKERVGMKEKRMTTLRHSERGRELRNKRREKETVCT